MSIAANVLSPCRLERAPSEATSTFKYLIMSALEKSWAGYHTLPVSVLEANLDGPTKALLQTTIYELCEAGVIEFAYGEGWTVGVRLTTKDLARPRLACSRNARRRQGVTMASAHDNANGMTGILRLLRFRSRAWLDNVYSAFKLQATNARFRLMRASHEKPWFCAASERQFRGRELEREAFIESMVRLPVAR